MAVVSRVEIALDSTKAAANAKSFAKSMDGVAGATRDANGRLRNAKGHFIGAGKAAAAAGAGARAAVPGVRALGLAFKTALGPLLGVAAAIGATTAALRIIAGQDFALAKVRSLGVESDVLAAALKDVSAELNGNASVAELTAAAYDVASAGFTDAADAALVLKAASLGAVGGFSDINTVGDAATSVLNAYGKSAADAALLVDGFIQTQNDGKIVVDQYAQNIGKVASAAAGLKIPITEINAVIAQSTASGNQAEIAFTGLKGALARLASGEATKALKGVGLNINAASLEADGLLGTFKKIAAAGLDTGQLFKAFGTEAGPALLPVLQNLEKFEELLENQKNAAGAAREAQQEAANTIRGAWGRVGVAVQNLFSDQAALAQAIIPILDAVSNAVNGITEATEGFKAVAEAVNGTVTNLGKQLGVVGDAFGGLGNAIKFAADQLGRLILRADGFDDPAFKEIKRIQAFDASQGAGFDIERIRQMQSGAANTPKKITKTNIPGFNPNLSGSTGNAANSGQTPLEKQLEASKKLSESLQNQTILATALTAQEKDSLQLRVDKLAIDKEFPALSEKQRQTLKDQLEALFGQKNVTASLIEQADARKTKEEEIAAAQEAAAQKLQQIYDQIGSTIASGVVDTLSAAVDQTKSLADAAANTLRNVANILLQLGVNTALQGTGLGIFKNLSGFANGGRPPVGKPSIVGERGPELFVPNTSGTIVPNNKLGGGGATNVVVNVDAKGSSASGDSGAGKQLGGLIGAAVQAELIKQQRPGGLLSR